MIKCIFCNQEFSAVHYLREHSAECSQHPAVILWRQAEAVLSQVSAECRQLGITADVCRQLKERITALRDLQSTEFEVVGRRTVSNRMAVIADSPQEALQKFRDQFPDVLFREIDIDEACEVDRGWSWVGRCEGCGCDLLDCDEYLPDSEHEIYVCGTCCAGRTESDD